MNDEWQPMNDIMMNDECIIMRVLEMNIWWIPKLKMDEVELKIDVGNSLSDVFS